MMQKNRTRRAARTFCSLSLAAATLWGVSVTAPAQDARSALRALRQGGELGVMLLKWERGGAETDTFSAPVSLALRMTPLLRESDLGFKTDTLIGYRDYFYGIDDIDKFRKFEENKIKLKGVYSSNCIITIDSRKLYFNIDSIFVEIKKLDIDEICKELDQNEKGEYMYNITNNIYIPFTKEELKIYLDNTRRYITIKANIEYSIKDRCIGSAIYLK